MSSNYTLIIAEKPSVARAISAGLLRGNSHNHEGYISGGNYIISWCLGHLLEACEPGEYNSNLKSWNIESLPFFPAEWKFKERKDSYVLKQFKILKDLISKAGTIIHAGDPDREGQLLVDELFTYLRFKPQQINAIQRVIITDLSPQGINKAFNQIAPNSNYQNLSQSALARQKSDWLLGINLTRVVTLYAQQAKYAGVLPIGRVLTPLLSMIVRRDLEIENFVPHDYYNLFAKIKLLNNTECRVTIDNREVHDQSIVVKLDLLATLKARHPELYSGKTKPKIEDLVNHEFFGRAVDEEGRIVNQRFLQYATSTLQDCLGTISSFSEKTSSQEPPIGYSLSDLQQAAFNIFGIPVDQTLSNVQQMYEQGLVTYPRTDCGYLNEEDFKHRHQVINNLASLTEQIPSLKRLNASNFNPEKKSKIWNSSKVENHSAIIPTSKVCPFASLSKLQQQLYQLIAQRYLMQFMPPATYQNTELVAEFTPEDKFVKGLQPWIFSANNKVLTDHGWKILTLSEKTLAAQNSEQSNLDLDEDLDDNGNSKITAQEQQARAFKGISKMLSQQHLENIYIGDMCQILEFGTEASKTTPPAHFNDATLLSSMTNIARYVESPELRKILNETDGLGTEATRAEIIKKLYTYEYCQRKNKSIISTEIGRGLIASLPNILTLPDTTAFWEKDLSQIAKGASNETNFINSIQAGIVQVINELHQRGANGFSSLSGLGKSRSYGGSSSSYRKNSYGKGSGKSIEKESKVTGINPFTREPLDSSSNYKSLARNPHNRPTTINKRNSRKKSNNS